jgi:hypothetical protein
MSSTDEFGRDLSLRKTINNLVFDLVARFNGMSWADINEEVEDEEQLAKEAKKKEEAKMREPLIQQRRKLAEQGLYELEDGEILE